MLCLSICGLLAGFANFEIIDKVNERLPQDKQFGWSWWYSEKYQRLRHEYKQIYPDGGLLLRVRALTALMLGGSEDRLTPPAVAQALFQKANEPKQLHIFPGADHYDIMEVGVAALEKQITAFIQTIH